MRIFFLNCSCVFGIWRYFTSLISKLLCFIKKRKNSLTTPDVVPFSIKVQGGNNSSEIQLVDWNAWEDEKAEPESRGKSAEELAAEELFKEMEPTINKAKIVHVKKKVRKPSKPSNNMFDFQPNHSFNFNPQYQVDNELGTLEDETTSAWDDGMDDQEISEQSENILKYNKQLEREKRAQEQKRKKVEKEQLRALKKSDSHIGVKIS